LREVTSAGAQKCGIEKTKFKMVGRGVFLDIPRVQNKEVLEDGYGITCDDPAHDCAADKVYEFMFVAPAIPITGAVGSPSNPLAIK
jgi:hypothetical protein